MSDAHRRPKTPEATRQALLDAGVRLALAEGLAALALPAVSAEAAVTKGAVFHHFGSRQGLVEAVAAEILARIDAEFQAALAKDAGGHGVLTRAYLHCIFHPASPHSPWAAPSLRSLADTALAGLWRDWIAAQMAVHADTDSNTALVAVRLAADGYWMSRVFGSVPVPPGPEALFAHLLARTRKDAP
jgi:AcrR family transcriptional regulator